MVGIVHMMILKKNLSFLQLSSDPNLKEMFFVNIVRASFLFNKFVDFCNIDTQEHEICQARCSSKLFSSLSQNNFWGAL